MQNVAADPAYAPVLAATRARLRRLCTPAPPGYSVIRPSFGAL
jgi:hypothetical protein